MTNRFVYPDRQRRMTVHVDPDGRAPYCAGTGTLYGEPIQCLRRTTNPDSDVEDNS